MLKGEQLHFTSWKKEVSKNLWINFENHHSAQQARHYVEASQKQKRKLKMSNLQRMNWQLENLHCVIAYQ